MRRLFPLLVLLLLASFGVAQAQDLDLYPPVRLLVYNVWVRPTAAAPAEGATPEPPLPGTVTSAYMTIENTSDQDYQLVSVDSTLAEMSMVHQTTIDDAGIARMRMVGTLDIPAGETVQLAPVGYHAMLMDVTRDLYPGEAVALTLTFADSSGATFSAPVGAFVTDFPPETNMLIAANAVAFGSTDETFLFVTLDNRSEQADTLVSVESGYGDVTLVDHVSRDLYRFEPVEILPRVGTPLEASWILMHLDGIPTSPEAFPLILTFESGKVITVAVPIILAGEAE